MEPFSANVTQRHLVVTPMYHRTIMLCFNDGNTQDLERLDVVQDVSSENRKHYDK